MFSSKNSPHSKIPFKKMLIILACLGALPCIFAPLPQQSSHQADLKEVDSNLRLWIPGSEDKHPIIDKGHPENLDMKFVTVKCGTDESFSPEDTTRTPHHLTSTESLNLELTLMPGSRRRNTESNAARKRLCSHPKNFSVDNVINCAKLENIRTPPDPVQMMISPKMQDRTIDHMGTAQRDSSESPRLTLGQAMSVCPDDLAQRASSFHSTQNAPDTMAYSSALRSWLTLGHQNSVPDTRNEHDQISDALAPIKATRRTQGDAIPDMTSKSTLTDSSNISMHDSNANHREVQPGIRERYSRLFQDTTHREFNALDHNGPSVQRDGSDSQLPSFKPIRLNEASSLSRLEKSGLVSRIDSNYTGTITGKSLKGRGSMQPGTYSFIT